MLVEFKFKNFLSYKDETSLLMTRVKSFKELEKETIISTKYFELLKTAAIYGSNGGGKTNFIQAVSFMNSVIHNSYADSLKEEEDRKIKKEYHFKLSEIADKEPSMFEVTFIKNNILYRYGFEIKGYEIIKEWLTNKKETETILFERERNEFTINNFSFPEGNKFKDSVNSNVLFLSYLAQNNGKVSSIIFDWFNELNIISGLSNRHFSSPTKHLLRNDDNFKKWLSVAVKFLNITNVTSNNEDRIIAYHNKFDKNEIIKESIAFDLETEESQGTIKLIYLLGAIYYNLLNSRILFIDELDSKLHPNLTKKLIEFFHKFNVNNSQFIFTAHDSILLDKNLFRRDQIWFVDKNKFGSSELYPMSDFNASVIRNTSDYRKKYLEMNFGAANTIDISEQLIELMYDKK
jgi:AAA15 family ATPase/GTPase